MKSAQDSVDQGQRWSKLMKPYLQQVATDHAGFLTQLGVFAQSLTAAEAAIETAMVNYRSVDDAVAGALGSGEWK